MTIDRRPGGAHRTRTCRGCVRRRRPGVASPTRRRPLSAHSAENRAGGSTSSTFAGTRPPWTGALSAARDPVWSSPHRHGGALPTQPNRPVRRQRIDRGMNGRHFTAPIRRARRRGQRAGDFARTDRRVGRAPAEQRQNRGARVHVVRHDPAAVMLPPSAPCRLRSSRSGLPTDRRVAPSQLRYGSITDSPCLRSSPSFPSPTNEGVRR